MARTAPAYGSKRDYPKIELFLHRPAGWMYMATTTWSRTCKEAKERFCAEHGHAGSDVRAFFKPSNPVHKPYALPRRK